MAAGLIDTNIVVDLLRGYDCLIAAPSYQLGLPLLGALAQEPY